VEEPRGSFLRSTIAASWALAGHPLGWSRDILIYVVMQLA
jgi:hypothetical protein